MTSKYFVGLSTVGESLIVDIFFYISAFFINIVVFIVHATKLV